MPCFGFADHVKFLEDNDKINLPGDLLKPID